jgi:uncharacterized protein YbbK (DUF523 family)/uncharacterized protein YbgA (DUF1722 family)
MTGAADPFSDARAGRVPAYKPRVVISKCIEFASCRHNGQIIRSDLVRIMRPFVAFMPVCPEVEVGLGVPRKICRFVTENDRLRLVQRGSGADLSGKMQEFADWFLDGLPAVDGFLLKNRSPSCALWDARVYESQEPGQAVRHAPGAFGGAVIDRFADRALEDDGRLRNFRLREVWLTKLFMLARWRQLNLLGSKDRLARFHSENRLLLRARGGMYSQALDTLIKRRADVSTEYLFSKYEKYLRQALDVYPTKSGSMGVFMELLSTFKNDLDRDEMVFCLNLMQDYIDGKAPLGAVKKVFQSHALRLKRREILTQSFFAPYPAELRLISDSGKGRDL